MTESVRRLIETFGDTIELNTVSAILSDPR
jgi:hypothetical protein